MTRAGYQGPRTACTVCAWKNRTINEKYAAWLRCKLIYPCSSWHVQRQRKKNRDNLTCQRLVVSGLCLVGCVLATSNLTRLTGAAIVLSGQDCQCVRAKSDIGSLTVRYGKGGGGWAELVGSCCFISWDITTPKCVYSVHRAQWQRATYYTIRLYGVYL